MRVVIVGASHAGIACAEALRQNGFDGDVTMIEQLPGLPLERPPLSKTFLGADPSDDARFAFRAADWFDAQAINLQSGLAVTGIDADARLLSTDDGNTVGYDRLVLATGATPRRLPSTEGLSGVFELRHPGDARAIRDVLADHRNAVIVGGGYIGLEVAASLVKRGVTVSLIEAADRLLARVASPPISAFFESRHRDSGVDLHIGDGVADILSDGSAFAGIRCTGGTEIKADMLVVGIGVLPETDLATMAGCATGNGILVGADMATSIDGIYAIGDGALVTENAAPAIGTSPLRIESVHNAQDSGARAAAAINGHEPPAHQAPWFWSEQYDVRLQSAGIVPATADDVVYVRRPGKREPGFSIWTLAGGNVCAVEAVQDPAGYMLGKKCLERGLSPDPAQIADPGFDMKSFVAG